MLAYLGLSKKQKEGQARVGNCVPELREPELWLGIIH